MFAAVAVSTALSLFALPSGAQTAPGFAVDRYEPSERGSDWFANESLDLRGAVRPAIGIVGDYAYRSLNVYRPNGDLDRSVIRDNLLAHLGASLVLADRLRLSASLPVQLYTHGQSATLGSGVTLLSPPDDQGIGDLRLAADVRLFGEYGDAATLAIGAQVWLPTGSRAQYMSNDEVRVRPRAMIAGDIGIFTYAAHAGFLYAGTTQTVDRGSIGNALSVGAAAGLRLVDKRLVVGPEIDASTVLDDPFTRRNTPAELLLGAHYQVASVKFGAGVGPGLSRGFGSPAVRGLLSVEWAPTVETDSDRDGIPDGSDACPHVRGVATDDPATNGCPPPPPPDRDGDGVFDDQDACVDVPGVATDDPATNGCPPDTDGDGILDKDDACPTEKGIKSTNASLNGCPDRDGDGIFDKEDACPDVAGIETNDPTTRGCPDPDRDKDGIPNDADACPDEHGPADPDPKRNGCPKAFVQQGQIKILDQVRFKTNSAEILPGKDSQEVLEAVAKVLSEHPEIKRVRVEGHTDNRGAVALNKRLSAARAASVVGWLAKHGIDKDRLVSAGFGPERPIATNQDEAGRSLNRRVEFHIEEPAPGDASESKTPQEQP